MAQAAPSSTAPPLFSPLVLFLSLLQNPHQLFIPNPSFSTSFRRNTLRPPNTLLPEEDPNESNNDDSSSPQRKIRNEMKREAGRAVKWGMELADNFRVKRVRSGLRRSTERCLNHSC